MIKFIKNYFKLIRYISLYGILRAINKAFARLRKNYYIKPFYFKKNPIVGLVGSGQFQFSTIAYYLSKGITNKFNFVFDIDLKQAATLAQYYNIPRVFTNNYDIYSQTGLKLVYIASNHESHANYAKDFLSNNIDVYCEKPISVSFDQFDALLTEIKKSKARFFAGYNRPYSPAVQEIGRLVTSKDNNKGKFSLNCFISAHDIPDDHWYRNPAEGTRICGNVGHWLDLMIHMYNWRGFIPKKFNVQLAYSNFNEPDDNIIISIITQEGDLTSITITARTEPFEGINETINFQYDTIIAKIDDFRKLTVWDEEKLYKKKYRPKDVGHRRSVMQPFYKDNRDLNEVIASTELMLHITEMVRHTVTEKEIDLTRSL